jgi:hypothetical protein
VPLPGWEFGGRELVVTAAGEGLEGDQGRVVLEQDSHSACRIDLVLAGATRNPFPAKLGRLEPTGDFDPAV